MMLSNGSHVNYAILTMVHSFILDGKINALMQMGFTTDQLNRIKGLTCSELSHIANNHALFINLKINTQMFDTILERAKEQEEMNAMIDKAISLGASIEILNSYFGLSTSNISCNRKLKALSISKGRMRKPNEEERSLIWKMWGTQIEDNPIIAEADGLERLLAYMDITQQVSMLKNDGEPLTLTSVVNELEPYINSSKSN